MLRGFYGSMCLLPGEYQKMRGSHGRPKKRSGDWVDDLYQAADRNRSSFLDEDLSEEVSEEGWDDEDEDWDADSDVDPDDDWSMN